MVQRMKLCGRCADCMRVKNIIRLVERDVTAKIECENCKANTYGALYEIEPKRRDVKNGR